MISTESKITIVYIFRNRDVERVRRSLESLLSQSRKDFKVIFIDFGSDKNTSHETEQLVSNYPFCKYIYNDTRGMTWNRSYALNTGLRLTKTDFVFTADIDMIFKNNFVEKLYSCAQQDEVIFFQVYYLPKTFSDWKNIEKGDFEKSKSFALGLSLLPLKTVREIGGYDEFYCFWGYEDNDLENRLNKAGVKTKFYDKEVLMFHQWHEPSIASQKNFPEGWDVFQNDYFLANKEIVKRNDDEKWGKLFSENERASVKIMNNPDSKFNVLNCSAAFFIYELNKRFVALNNGSVLLLEFNDINSLTHINSKLGKIISKLQFIINSLKLPVNIISGYRHLYSTVYDVRNDLMVFLASHHDLIEDYYLEIKDRNLKLILIKK